MGQMVGYEISCQCCTLLAAAILKHHVRRIEIPVDDEFCD